MSNMVNARNSAESSKRPSTSLGAKFRGPSSRVATKDRPLSSGEVIPEDSASNAPPRRSASEVHEINGGSRTGSERQSGKVQLSVRDSARIRTRSPVKISSDGISEARPPKERFPVRPSSLSTERDILVSKEEYLRELL